MIPYDKREGKIWYNGDLVEWQDAQLHDKSWASLCKFSF